MGDSHFVEGGGDIGLSQMAMFQQGLKEMRDKPRGYLQGDCK